MVDITGYHFRMEDLKVTGIGIHSILLYGLCSIAKKPAGIIHPGEGFYFRYSGGEVIPQWNRSFFISLNAVIHQYSKDPFVVGVIMIKTKFIRYPQKNKNSCGKPYYQSTEDNKRVRKIFKKLSER
jgi:hypothetical protein